MTGNLYIGLMSGTSADGVDGVLCRFNRGCRVIAHRAKSFDTALRAQLLDLNQPGADELSRSAEAAHRLTLHYAAVVRQLLRAVGAAASDVRAIGAHGQTVRHQPPGARTRSSTRQRAPAYSLQINNPALLAELCGIDVIADFRNADIAAGGEGAPLVPAFHQAVFSSQRATQAVLNIGGIANLTVLTPRRPVIGFDCGPGNALMDSWCETHTSRAFDRGGRWAAQGQVDDRLLRRLLKEPFLHRPPPKSTGRDLFNLKWLQRHLLGQELAPCDVQATLAEFTAVSIANSIRDHASDAQRVYACGGGAFNQHLMARLQAHLGPIRIVSPQERGMLPEQIEAAAFAWLAMRRVRGLPGNLTSVTGAVGERVLGGWYAAPR